MSIKWAAVCINQYDGDILSVDLFEKYDDAKGFIRKDAEETELEIKENDSNYNTFIDDFGSFIALYVDDEINYSWSIEPTNIH